MSKRKRAAKRLRRAGVWVRRESRALSDSDRLQDWLTEVGSETTARSSLVC